MLKECNVDQSNFWKSVGKIGVGQIKKKCIPLEVTLNDGSLSTDLSQVLNKWKHDFSSLYKNDNYVYSSQNSNVLNDVTDYADLSFNANITIFEVKKAIDGAKKGKACGIDGIPSEVLQNDTSVLFLHTLFNVCFSNGTVPSIWGKCIINPIPKPSMTDSRDPLSYRGIALASAMYKIYCNILNARLSCWAEHNDKIADEQNGFRKKRSTIDHLSTLTSIIDTRKQVKKATFCAFIDFSKAYDFINRDKLWKRLNEIGVAGNMWRAVKSIYSSVSSCIRVNSFKTDWFDVNCGLRQGCILSPLLFNLYINDLTIFLKSLNIGVNVDNDCIGILLYADDIVLLAENQLDLQRLLNALHDWCNINDMFINRDKSKVVHFRPASMPRSDVIFKCGVNVLETIGTYTYLGIVLSEYLDFNVTAKCVAQSASRALGLLIAKCKLVGGVPYNVFSKLYDSVVWPVIAYGAPVWGYKAFSCINAIHNRAMRFFLGVGKYSPNAAVSGEMGWQPPVVRQWKHISGFWARLANTDNSRLNKRVALWANAKSTSYKNWFYYVKRQFADITLMDYCNLSIPIHKHNLVDSVENAVMEKYVTDWSTSINSVIGVSGRGRNKLRTYCTFKFKFQTEVYCKMILPTRHRSALCKFRCGVAPLRIETGRYENLPLDERKCPFCNVLEDESHVLLECSLYDDLRAVLLEKASLYENDFRNKPVSDQLRIIFTTIPLIRIVAKTCFYILQRRSFYLCK